ncbi:hypothetical protein [Collimonas sp.]|jgi:hypothetical protein|uniref:hypothetical protein n=1 Tax=Collimonas sp. TaxID=1963772 RepID=UPI0037C127DF
MPFAGSIFGQPQQPAANLLMQTRFVRIVGDAAWTQQRRDHCWFAALFSMAIKAVILETKQPKNTPFNVATKSLSH